MKMQPMDWLISLQDYYIMLIDTHSFIELWGEVTLLKLIHLVIKCDWHVNTSFGSYVVSLVSRTSVFFTPRKIWFVFSKGEGGC